MTVLEVIQKSSEFLARKGIDSPRLQVELMLAELLQVPRLKLYLDFERVLTDPQLTALRAMVKRRAEREPLQHIVGSACFCGLDFAVTPDVLIPRPETELLAERAWQYLQRLEAESAQERPSILDVGTGTGCLAITLATRCPATTVQAVDISEPALAIAILNAKRHGVSDRIQFHHSDVFSVLPKELRFDLIVSNPPYIPTAELRTLQPEVRNFDPALALDGGMDGLTFYRRLATEAPAYLKSQGRLMAEFGHDQAEPIAHLFRSAGWTIEELARDLAGNLRIIIARGPLY